MRRAALPVFFVLLALGVAACPFASDGITDTSSSGSTGQGGMTTSSTTTSSTSQTTTSTSSTTSSTSATSSTASTTSSTTASTTTSTTTSSTTSTTTSTGSGTSTCDQQADCSSCGVCSGTMGSCKLQAVICGSDNTCFKYMQCVLGCDMSNHGQYMNCSAMCDMMYPGASTGSKETDLRTCLCTNDCSMRCAQFCQ